MGKDIEPPSWDECVDLLLSSGGSETIYRGHRCFDWNLQSTLERALLERAEHSDQHRYQMMLSNVVDRDTDAWANETERDLTRYFRSDAMRFGAQDLPEAWDTLGWWEVMQHHGTPTRLMDWTFSPFIALWFALDGHCRGDMALWIYDRRTGMVNHSAAEAKLRSQGGYDQLDERRLLNDFVRLAIEDGNPALVPVQPRQFPRSVAQQSVLTVSPSISTAHPAHWWIRKKLATRIRLPEGWKPDMVAACRSMGLTRPGLFRDLDSLGAHLSKSLRSGATLTDWLP